MTRIWQMNTDKIEIYQFKRKWYANNINRIKSVYYCKKGLSPFDKSTAALSGDAERGGESSLTNPAPYFLLRKRV